MRASLRPAGARKAARPTMPPEAPLAVPGSDRRHHRLYLAYTQRLAELIRSDARGHRDSFLGVLLGQWEQARRWRASWIEAGDDVAGIPGTLIRANLAIVEAFCQVASWELRRAICGTTPGDPPPDQAACAWVGGTLVVSLPFRHFPRQDEAFLVIDPPQASARPGARPPRNPA